MQSVVFSRTRHTHPRATLLTRRDSLATPRCALSQAVEENACKEREIWFTDIRACRRRKQLPLASTPVARLFTTPDQYHLLQHRATVARIRSLVFAKRMFLLDVFNAFDSDRNGLLGCSELFSGLVWLGTCGAPARLRPERSLTLIFVPPPFPLFAPPTPTPQECTSLLPRSRT